MSFGFSIGDFLAVIELASKVRKEFAGAPSQFQEISAEIRSLMIILQDVEDDDDISNQELSDEQKRNLGEFTSSCQRVLDDLRKAISKYDTLGSEQHGIKRGKRVWERLRWDASEIRDFRSRITSNIQLLVSFQQQCSSRTINNLARSQEDQDRRVILDWLTPIDYDAQQTDFISRRQPDTGIWFLNSLEYRSWVDTKKQTLFCPGIPGVGKTILSSIVVDDLFSRFKDDNGVGIAYIYCNFRRQSRQTMTDITLSLLKQLAQRRPSLPDAVKNLYKGYGRDGMRPSNYEVSGALETVISSYSRVFVIVDALDECQVSNGTGSKLISGIFNIQQKHETNFLATSRFIPDITASFKGYTTLEIRASKADVEKYVDDHIEELPSFVAGKPGLKDEIIRTISDAADGMFLLAQLYLRSLRSKTTPRKLKTALDDFGKQSGLQTEENKIKILNSAYETAMERINGQEEGFKDLAIRILSWITCAKRPLTTLEIQHALAVEVGDQEIDENNIVDIGLMLSVCAGLVTIDEKSNIIRLVHYTVQEYFERTQDRWFPEAQLSITKVCVAYLSFQWFSGGVQEQIWSNPLYEYVIESLGHHVRASPLCQEVLSFLKSPDPVKVPAEFFMWTSPLHRPSTGQATALHIACYFDLLREIENIVDCDLEVKDSAGETPLAWAIRYGRKRMVRLLVEKGAKIQVPLMFNII
ncbi:hypothetical protein F4813DRAFT_378815 [Daldinia decipiens]|uniref:uncharacterized protein n=1 Tax=Daldinia decipiens TaxID=326647 RepID=UPI0020C30F95|nr:uncharacterized protein F4813DRAFT_378815 [Daldinia decipiens]KAI1661134.1 hypothetical protein F4813DRAFT_378815 [Daldinia decipiens]